MLIEKRRHANHDPEGVESNQCYGELNFYLSLLTNINSSTKKLLTHKFDDLWIKRKATRSHSLSKSIFTLTDQYPNDMLASLSSGRIDITGILL